MNWLKASASALSVVTATSLIYVLANAQRSEHPVGFQIRGIQTANGPMAVAIWYPTTGRATPTTLVGNSLLSISRNGAIAGHQLPLLVISHGNGGGALSHVDLAMEMASAGFVVAAPTHIGDNSADVSRQGSPMLFSQRAGQLRSTLDYMLGAWPGAAHVDAARVSAFGMSAGAFTVLTLIGARPDMDRIASHCAQDREFICRALEHVGSPLLRGSANVGLFRTDPRIKAAIVVAPGLGFTFTDGGLREVHVPVQLWFGNRDTTVPYGTNILPIRHGLGAGAEVHELKGATHFSFLAPCGLIKPRALCADPDGFDRKAAHKTMNGAILAFASSHD
ncbi:MAG: hypothetical protein NAOJABEB_02201 [Steroidobacteraceae bacterium]|nr:hypothetical protein [Steroidobacteraceae bacterium]